MADSNRIVSLDQFRGYTVLGMFLVNFIGSYQATPTIFRHMHTFCSYADTIMPQFLFAVGFSLRLVYLKRREKLGASATYSTLIRRSLGLFLVAIVVHHLTGNYRTWAELTSVDPIQFLTQTFKRGPFETLGHIAVTTLFILPVIAAPGWVRVLYAAAAGAFHVWMSYAFYYEWVWPHSGSGGNGVDGGPLAFFVWSIAALFGTLAYDWLVLERSTSPLPKLLVTGLILMAGAYGLSCLHRITPPNSVPENASWTAYFVEPPFVPPASQDEAVKNRTYWVMSQRPGTLTYLMFSTGFALWVMAGFHVICDLWRFRSGYLDLLGQHALSGYIVHGLVGEAVKPFVPRDSPGWFVTLAFLVNLGIITLILKYFEKNKYYLRL